MGGTYQPLFPGAELHWLESVSMLDRNPEYQSHKGRYVIKKVLHGGQSKWRLYLDGEERTDLVATSLTAVAKGADQHYKASLFRLPEREENPEGLHQRYHVQKTRGHTDPRAVYFVLRLDSFGNDRHHIQACREAVFTYCAYMDRHSVSHMTQTAKELGALVSRLSLVSFSLGDEELCSS